MTEAERELLLLLAARIAGDPGDPAVWMEWDGPVNWTDRQAFRQQLFGLMQRIREGK